MSNTSWSSRATTRMTASPHGTFESWLEGLREQLIASGTPVDRPEPQAGEVGVELTEWQARIADLIARLTRDVPARPGWSARRNSMLAGFSPICWTFTVEKRNQPGGNTSD